MVLIHPLIFCPPKGDPNRELPTATGAPNQQYLSTNICSLIDGQITVANLLESDHPMMFVTELPTPAQGLRSSNATATPLALNGFPMAMSPAGNWPQSCGRELHSHAFLIKIVRKCSITVLRK